MRERMKLTPGWTLVAIVGLLVIALLVVILATYGTGSGSGGS
jgi:hypothetical protein